MAAMKKIQAQSLEEAYRIACETLGCSMKELEYEVIQYPRSGFLGLFAKPAIIIASCGERKGSSPEADGSAKSSSHQKPAKESSRQSSEESEAPALDEEKSTAREETGSHEEIVERFFEEESRERPGQEREEQGRQTPEEIAREIETTLRELFDKSCFNMDVIEVDVMEDTAYIFLDGEDAALIIGKEGYRYNALSYLLYNWIHTRYKLYIKLEVAEFLLQQQEMIRNMLQPVIEHVKREGWGRTRPLDGILVQIALEQLREAFPDKYVAIKRQRNGGRYVLINEFNSPKRR